MTKQQFIELVKPEALKACKDNFKIPSLLIAQSALESGWLKSSLAYKYNNLLGRKWASNNVITDDSVKLKTKEWNGIKYIVKICKFCVYKNIADCFRDYIWLLHNLKLKKNSPVLRYQRVLDSKDYLEATEMIRLCGYATSPTYTKSLRNIITQFKLNELDK